MKAEKHIRCGRAHLLNGNTRKAAAHFERARELRFGVNNKKSDKGKKRDKSDKGKKRDKSDRGNKGKSDKRQGDADEEDLAKKESDALRDHGYFLDLMTKYSFVNANLIMRKEKIDEKIKSRVFDTKEMKLLYRNAFSDSKDLGKIVLGMIKNFRLFRKFFDTNNIEVVITALQAIKEFAPFSCARNKKVGIQVINTLYENLISERGITKSFDDVTYLDAVETAVTDYLKSIPLMHARSIQYVDDFDKPKASNSKTGPTDPVPAETLFAVPSVFAGSSRNVDAGLERDLRRYNLFEYYRPLTELGLKSILYLPSLLNDKKSEMNSIFKGNLELVKRAIDDIQKPARQASDKSDTSNEGDDTHTQTDASKHSDPILSHILSAQEETNYAVQAQEEQKARIQSARLNQQGSSKFQQVRKETSSPESGVPASVKPLFGEEKECISMRFQQALEKCNEDTEFCNEDLKKYLASIDPDDIPQMRRTVLLFEKNTVHEPNKAEKVKRMQKNRDAVNKHMQGSKRGQTTAEAELRELCHDKRDAKDNPVANCLWKAGQDSAYDWAFVSDCILFTLYCVSVRLINVMSHAEDEGIEIPVTSPVVDEFQAHPIKMWIDSGSKILDDVLKIGSSLDEFFQMKYGGVKNLQARARDENTTILWNHVSTFKHYKTVESILLDLKYWDMDLPPFRACVLQDASTGHVLWAVFRGDLKETRKEGTAEVFGGNIWEVNHPIRMTHIRTEEGISSFSVINLENEEVRDLILVQCHPDINVTEGTLMPPLPGKLKA